MLALSNISKSFREFSLKDISFTVKEGDYFILLGASGAGKSLLLETIAGIVHPDSGSLVLDGKNITKERIQRRKTGLVFQDHAVFPHLSVRENLAYPLRGLHLTSVHKKERIEATASALSIGHLLARSPETLSGGELQRVALGRALIQQPRILLLDEPLSSLDTRLKSELRRLLRSIHAGGQTILHVTHDYEEALSLATRVAVIHDGRIIQAGTPDEVFHHPQNEFIASFVGIPNFFPARVVSEGGTFHAIIENNLKIKIIDNIPQDDVALMIRGEDILLSDNPVETSATNNFEGLVTEVIPTRGGMDVVVNIGVEVHAWVTTGSVEKFNLRPGSRCWVHFKATAVRIISN